MHWSLWGVSHLSLVKLGNYNQILDHVADQDYIAFIDLITNLYLVISLKNVSALIIVFYYPIDIFESCISGNE